MDKANLAQKTARCLRAMLDCGALGARHGPRLGMQVGAICGTVFPLVGNVVGAALGGLVGGPLGFLMGLVGGAVNRRWGWTLGAALPALIVLGLSVADIGRAIASANPYDTGEWEGIVAIYSLVVAIVAGVAGSKLGKALETSTERHFDAAFAARQALATIPLALRLGVLFALLWTLADVVYGLAHILR